MTSIIDCIKTVGRGARSRKPLSFEQAETVMREYLAGQHDDDQMAMLMMLIRVQNETPAEVAGFVKAFQSLMPNLQADIDWPCYAGKRSSAGAPWHALAAKILAENGYKVLMHGHFDPSSERLHAEQVLDSLSIARASSVAEAQQLLDAHNIAYLPLQVFAPQAVNMLGWQRRYGLRTPINTVMRALNPAKANVGVRGSFHPGFQQLHAEVEHLVGQTRHAVVSFKGQSGESEYNPKVSQTLWLSQASGVSEHYWPAQMDSLPLPATCPLHTPSDLMPFMANTVVQSMSAVLFAYTQDRAQAQAKAVDYWQTYCGAHHSCEAELLS